MSAIKCPQCGTEIENQFGFGMIECPHCQHMFMDSAAPEESPSQSIGEVTLASPENTSGAFVPPELPEFGSGFSEGLAASGMVGEPQALPKPETEATSSQSDNIFNDVVEFGNSEVSAMGSNALFYDIEIFGIDTPELRMELELVLDDKKLNLPRSTFMSKIKEGVLKLPQVHPVRAAVLVSRLRETHLQVKWSTDQMIRSIKTLILIFGSLFFFTTPSFASSWEYHDQSLKSYAIKINNLQDDIHEAIGKKNHETDLKKKQEYLEEIKRKYADLRAMHKDFLKEMEHVRYEHPERGDKVERKYLHLKIKTLEELENDNTLDGQLSRLKRKAEMTYQPAGAPTPEATPSASKKKSLGTPD